MNKIQIARSAYTSKRIFIPTEMLTEKTRHALECLSIWNAADNISETHTSYEIPDFIDMGTLASILIKIFNLNNYAFTKNDNKNFIEISTPY